MKPETQIRIGRVRKFSRVARWICTGFLAIVVLASTAALFIILTGPTDIHFRVELGRISFMGDQIDTVALKVWLTLLLGVGLYIASRMLWLLHGLFGNLARGEIYTQANVRRLRSVGWLLFNSACLQVVVPVITMMLMASRVIEWSQATYNTNSYLNAASISTFVIAGIIILMSWIMDVGLEVSEEAETLRREAELVV